MIWFFPVGEQEATRHTPWVTWTLVVLNVLAFLAMLLSTDSMDEWIRTYGLTPSDAHWWQFITGNFVHAGPIHLIGNLLFLVIFGDNVEDVLGPLGFVALYFLGGLAGDATFVGSNPELAIPSVGASGCIATLAGAYAVMFFNRAVDIKVFVFIFPVATLSVPSIFLLLFYFGADVWLTAASNGVMHGGGTNYVAHGMGFVAGLLAGAMAAGSGAVARFRSHREGHAWFGYLPWNLGRRTRWRG